MDTDTDTDTDIDIQCFILKRNVFLDVTRHLPRRYAERLPRTSSTDVFRGRLPRTSSTDVFRGRLPRTAKSRLTALAALSVIIKFRAIEIHINEIFNGKSICWLVGFCS